MTITTNNSSIESPCNTILAMAQKFILSQVLFIFSKLGLEKLLEKRTLTLSEIATSLNVHPIALRRFLRLLTTHDLIKDLGNDTFESTPIFSQLNKILNASIANDYCDIDAALSALQIDRNNVPNSSEELLRTCLNNYLTQSTSPIHDFILARIVMSAAELQLGNLLKNGPLSLDDISAQLNIPLHILKPFMQILSTHNITQEKKPNFFSSTPLSECLDRVLSPHILDGYKVFHHALHTLKNNTGSWDHAFGNNFYDYLNKYPEKLQMFKAWCTQSAIDWLPPILSLCNFPLKDKLLIDVAGGSGHFLAAVLQQNPYMCGILFDQPSIIEGDDKCDMLQKIEKRVELIGGDFFQSIPSGGDVYTICRTLLNWNDEKAISILNNCHTAMNGKGKLWIIDFLIPNPEHSKYSRAVMNDISLFVILNSIIRTEEEWKNLISQTPFTVCNISITHDDIKPEPYYPMCIIEISPKKNK